MAPQDGVGMTRRRFLQTSGLAAATSLSSCRRGSRSSGKKILRLRSYADLQNLDPAFTISQAEEVVYDAINCRLIRFESGPTWTWKLDAAESIRRLDDRHIEFVLRPGIQFTNGFGEMTADDVKFSFERIIDPKLNASSRGEWGPLEEVQVSDRYTGTIVLREPFEPLWQATLPYTAGNILSRKAVEAVGGRFGTDPPCCSGPYVLHEFVPKQRAVLVRNGLWKGPSPDFDEIRIYPIEDEKTAEIAFEAGDLDFTRISVSSYAWFKSNPPPECTVSTYTPLDYNWLGMNLDHPSLNDPRLRRAIQLAIDVEKVVEAAWFGAAEPATGIIAPGLLGHRPDTLLPIRGDVDLARKFLIEAGYGAGLEVTLDVQNTNQYITAGQIIQSQLARIGIRVVVNLRETGAFFTLGNESAGDRWRDIQLILSRFSMAPEPYYATEWFTQRQVGVWNWERFRSPEFDRLHRQAMKEADPEERAAMYRKMQDLMEESGAYRFLTHGARPLLFRNSLLPGLKPDGTAVIRDFRRV